MVALGVTTDADVVVSVGVGRVAGAADATGAVRPRRTLGARRPELRTTFLDRDGRGIVLRGKIRGTKQNRQQAKKDLNKTLKEALKMISSPYCALSRVCLRLLFCFM